MISLLLAAIGAYGTIAHRVGQRLAELGVRTALGANRAKLLTMVVRQGMTPVLLGAVAGVLGALLATRVMAGLLFGVAANDLPTYVVASAVLLGTALAATTLPAWGATRIDPAKALRAD